MTFHLVLSCCTLGIVRLGPGRAGVEGHRLEEVWSLYTAIRGDEVEETGGSTTSISKGVRY